MYGLIHKAIRGCLQNAYGAESWARVAARSGVDSSDFLSFESYPDEVTVGLLVTASEELERPLPELLRDFGRYWVLNTARVEYGPIFEFGGADFIEFLDNLDAMHEQVALSFSNLQQPSFAVEKKNDGRIILHYESIRDGLSDFVIGLIEGLSEHFSQPVKVQLIEARADGAHHDVFEVSLHA